MNGQPAEVRECGTCGNVAIGNGPVQCCEQQMDRRERTDAVAAPTLEELLFLVFDISETELEVCLCIMEGGDMTVRELAEQIDHERSVVAEHLRHLTEIGVIDRERRILKQGGHVYVYRPLPPETVRERLTAVFLTWVGEAIEQFATLRQEKVESIAAADMDATWEIFREQ
ncbi:helix-turn-helix domain-containing protein [Halorhabdus salina]|uniref:helix-turn-helix domain-containing protein n=1 Tax=Halorhabdus salina TaxID=2750670 RepID=UPI0015EE6BA5|nr:helix-turn-helix domain-containing protein [Halorhabdus salina]